jgi:hypothetical protein
MNAPYRSRPSWVGSQRVIAGMKVISSRATKSGIIHGRIAIVVRSTESFDIAREHEKHHADRRRQETDHQVQREDQAQMHRIDAVTAAAIGIRIGTRMLIAAMVSRKAADDQQQDD